MGREDQECAEFDEMMRWKKMRDQLTEARELIDTCLPIVEEAFWDQHTAGIIPGSGFSNKAQHLAGQVFGWREPKKFTAFKQRAQKFLEGQK